MPSYLPQQNGSRIHLDHTRPSESIQWDKKTQSSLPMWPWKQSPRPGETQGELSLQVLLWFSPEEGRPFWAQSSSSHFHSQSGSRFHNIVFSSVQPRHRRRHSLFISCGKRRVCCSAADTKLHSLVRHKHEGRHKQCFKCRIVKLIINCIK